MTKPSITTLLVVIIFSGCNFTGEDGDCTVEDVRHFYNQNLSQLTIDTLNQGVQEIYSVYYRSAFGQEQFVSFYQKGGVNHVQFFSLPKRSDEPPDFIKSITDDDWNKLLEIVEEFDFWEEPICRVEDALDGYLFAIHGLKPSRFNFSGQHEKHLLRSSTSYDKIDALCGYLFDYAEQLN